MTPPMTMSFAFRPSRVRTSLTHRTNTHKLVSAKVTIEPEGFTKLLELMYPGDTTFPPLKVLEGMIVEYREIIE